MSKVHLTQLLCPQRHCLLALAWEDDKATVEEASAMLMEQVGPVGFANPWCELCKSRDLHTEDGVIAGCTSLEQAKPILAAAQEVSLRTRENFMRAQGAGPN